ncbi:MAG TPA: L-threonylcarbamoyladenylate synthase [Candidatus Dojkabacteria bacterium]|nr:L-threonylcarbamoyladenylate synthase [Candidatus Dojkabacteria bacterium]HRP36301.1 L-threonylcarbamoyladenylate synthase [Candidatus Dojkabacteria bacterium]HRP51063.1 L-threonylcarbamoyladenylate synthase [Candidatus Dojkabacteria bacterium]
MKILELNVKNKKSVIDEAVAVFKNGGLVVYPTETCYGAGVMATNENAVKKLLKYKKRPSGKAISIAVANIEMAKSYVIINKTAESVYEKFLPGPVTVVSESKNNVADGIASEFNTLGVRIPNFEFMLDVIEELGSPITATSANSAGKKTPYNVADILDNLSENQKSLIDLIIDAGQLPKNPPSTVVDTTRESMQILREGSLDISKDGLLVTSEEEMREHGEKFMEKNFSALTEKGLLIFLNAELGAGKTQFVKGIAKSMGIEEVVKSPTYSIMEEYDAPRGKLIHIDTWRLTNISELKQLMISKYLKKGSVIAIEWSAGVEEYFNEMANAKGIKTVKIDINYIDENKRRLMIWD